MVANKAYTKSFIDLRSCQRTSPILLLQQTYHHDTFLDSGERYYVILVKPRNVLTSRIRLSASMTMFMEPLRHRMEKLKSLMRTLGLTKE